jgi:DNA-binding XRE family transcriptional regulator
MSSNDNLRLRENRGASTQVVRNEITDLRLFRYGSGRAEITTNLNISSPSNNGLPMVYSNRNLVTGRQLRAARTLAGMTQQDLARVLGINERAIRFWERKHDRRPTSAPNGARIEQALLARGVILFAEPTPGARLAEKR